MKNISLRVNNLPLDEIKRPTIIDTIKRTLSNNNLVILEGESGSGKTTFLSQFVHLNSKNCISYFIDPSDRFTYGSEAFKIDLINQFYIYIFGIEFPDENVPDNFVTSLRIKLEKKIKERKTDFYIILDGLDSIDFNDAAIFLTFIDDLPYKKIKFLISGEQSKILKFFEGKKIEYRTTTLNFFTQSETKEYFQEFTPNEENLNEIYKISNKGQPSRLSTIKRNCKEKGLDFYLNNDLSEKSDLFELEWQEIKFDSLLENIIGIIVFGDSKFNISTLSSILNESSQQILLKLQKLTFIESINGQYSFISENYRSFAVKKLENIKDRILGLLISFYTNNLSEDKNNLNLPTLYLKAKRYSELINHLSLDRLIHYIEKTNSIFFINKQFEIGLKATKENLNSEGEYLKFSLHKSSLRSIENEFVVESEIESLVKLNEIEQAKNKILSIQIKETRFKGLALLVKILKENNIDQYDDLVKLVEDLYQEIDIELFKENVIEISSLLIYCNPNIAIDLIEKFTDTTSSKNSIDFAFAYLSLFVHGANKQLNKNLIDIERINSKIKDAELKSFTNAISYIGSEYSIKEIMELIDKIQSSTKKFTLLRNWLGKNKSKEGIDLVLEYALNLVIQSSSDTVPNASVLYEICLPLPNISDKTKLLTLIGQIDSQKSTINTPTRDFIKLQLLIAESLKKHDTQKYKERIFETFITIDEIKDITVRTDCFVSLFRTLKKTDLNNEIESELTNTSILNIIKENCLKLLETTAYQFKIFEYTIKQIIIYDQEFIFKLIENINIKERRLSSYKVAALSYIKNKPVSEWDKSLITDFYNRIETIQFREEISIQIFDTIEKIKDNDKNKTPNFSFYINLLTYIIHPETKTYCIAKILNIIRIIDPLNQKLIDFQFSDLYKSWDLIDSIWDKIIIGYKISSNLSSSFPDIAKKYLDDVTKIKNEENITSFAIANTYVSSIRLSIKAFEGTLSNKDSILTNIEILKSQIEKIKSVEEQLKLWNELALILFKTKQTELAKSLVEKHIVTALHNSKDNLSLKYRTFDLISTGLFIYHADLLKTELSNIDEITRNRIFDSIINFLITKISPSEPILNDSLPNILTYNEFLDIFGVLELIKDDSLLYNSIDKICACIIISKLPLIQKNELKRRLSEIIDKNLPNPESGVKHDGYKIVSKAKLLSLDSYDKTKFDQLINDTSLIPNVSDKSLVYCFLSEHELLNKTKKNELINNSLQFAKQIPCNYDKFNRVDALLSSLIDNDHNLFKNKIKEIFNEAVADKNSAVSALTNLIDLAQKHDSRLAESLISVLDTDPSRKILKAPLMRRIENKELRIKADKDFNKICDIKSIHDISKYSEDKLAELNSGKLTSKDIKDTFSVLENISKLPLEGSFNCASFFISNAIKKCQNSPKGQVLLNSIFTATVENTTLIDVISTDSLSKMRSKLTFNNIHESNNNPRLSFNSRGKAIEYIRNWVETSVENKLYIIDPFFDENDLEVLKIFKEIKPQAEIVILTSKGNGINSHDNNDDIYQKKWNDISTEQPPVTRIEVVWLDTQDKKSPIHDRWWITSNLDTGLSMGTSFNSIGVSKESQINRLSDDSLQTVSTIIRDYLIDRISIKDGKRIKYSYIYLT